MGPGRSPLPPPWLQVPKKLKELNGDFSNEDFREMSFLWVQGGALPFSLATSTEKVKGFKN